MTTVPDQILARRLLRLLLTRLLVVGVFLSTAVWILDIRLVVFYSLVVAVLALSVLYVVWLALRRQLVVLGYVQLAADLVIETILIHYTGGVDSVFVALYLLSIVGASVVLPPGAHIVSAAASSAMYTILVALEYVSWRLPAHEGLYLVYMVYVRVTIFCLVGMLAGYLARAIYRLEEQAKEREKFSLLGELTASIAHEIRNPLASIAGSVEVLKRDLAERLRPADTKLMEGIVTESERLSTVLEKALDYAREGEYQLAPVSLAECVNEVVSLAKHDPLCTQSPVTIHEPHTAKPVWVSADKDRIKQVFFNIVVNAFQAMPAGGELSVDIEQRPKETRILFQDTGRGMSAETLKTLFIPFKSSRKNGTGIGLAIANKIMHHHGGRIQVKSRVGKGTCFTVVFPQ